MHHSIEIREEAFIMMYIAIVISVVLGAGGQIFMKIAMQRAGSVPISGTTAGVSLQWIWQLVHYYIGAVFSWPMFLALSCYGISYLLWLGILSRADLTFARPFVSLGYIIVIFYGYWAGEAMHLSRVVGIILIMIGLIFVAYSGHKV